MRGVNLLPGYRLESRLRQDRVKRWGTGCGVYAASLVAIWCGAQLLSPDGRHAVASDLTQLESRTQSDQAAAKALNPRLAQAYTSLAATHSIGDQPDWSHLVALLAELLGDEAVLRSCKLDPAPVAVKDAKPGPRATRISRYQLRLEGFGRTQASVLAYVRQLEDTRLFDSVTLIETRGEAFHTSQAIAFNIECILSDGERTTP